MFDFDNIVNLVIENIKKLFFPEEWIELDLKFSKSELFSMLYIDKRKEVTMSELVEYINTPMSTATGIIDRLVKNGYVKRERSETDRRIVVLRLTEEGLRFIKELKDMIYEYLGMAIKDLTEEEKQFMARIVLKILNNLQNRADSKTHDGQKEDAIKAIDIE